LKAKRIAVNVVKCPNCGREYEFLTAILGEPWRCHRCGFVFGSSHEPIPRRYWIEKEVDALKCDLCGALIPCTRDNMLAGLPLPAVACHSCSEPTEFPVFSSHLIGLLYRGKWRSPRFFMRKSGADGLLPARSVRDRVTAWLIATEAMLGDDLSIRPVHVFERSVSVKLLWAEGEAVGMYTYTLDGSWGMPCMHVIAVRREYRRRGYGTRMVRDFLDSFPGEVGFESPNSVLCRLLVKLGAAEERDGGYYAKGRVSFMSSGM